MALGCLGRYSHALRQYQRAEQIYSQQGEILEAARIGRAELSVLIYLGRYKEALDIAARVQSVFERTHQTKLLAELKANLGGLYHHLDRYHESLELYKHAKKLLHGREDSLPLAHVNTNLAIVYSCLGDYERSFRLFEQARELYQMLSMPLLGVQTEYNLAYLELLRGKFDEAMRLFTKVKSEALDLGETSIHALCDLDLAELYLQLNAYVDVVESTQTAAQNFAELKMNYEQAKATMFGGIAKMQLGDLDSSALELRQAKRVFQREGNQVYSALCNLYLADVHRRKGDAAQGYLLADEAYQLFRRSRLDIKAAYAQLQMAQMKAEMGNLKRARQLVERSLRKIKDLEAPWLEYQCHSLLGHLAEEFGDEVAAYQQYDQAIKLIESLRSRIRVDEMKASFLSDKLKVYEGMVGLCLRDGSRERLEEAFTYVEAAKSRALLDLLGAALKVKTEGRRPLDRKLYQRWKKLREELDWYYSTFNQLQQRSGPTQRDLALQIQGEIRLRESELNRLLRTVQLEHNDQASLHLNPQVVLSDLTDYLSDDEAILEYYVAGGEIKAFVLDRDGLRLIRDLPSEEQVLPLLRKLRFHLDKHVFNGEYVRHRSQALEVCTKEYLKALHSELIAPLGSLAERKKLILVPHGFLHYVPFHALYDGRRYLVEDHEVSYCPSASIFKLCVDKYRRQADPAGGPLKAQPLIVGAADQMAPYIGQEVQAVSALFAEAQVLLGDHATAANFKEHVEDCDLIHLACHAVFRHDNPIFSALRLQNSWLNFYDIWNLDLRANLLTLSACQTGMNKIFPGDELIGLMRGFLYAGVPSLVVSLWAVNDTSTADFMGAFYSRLKEGRSKRDALREAQLATKEKYANPYFWAPFVLMGNPN
jgi:CHAT domain-containing protein